jgi:hypothetical protein
VNTAGIPVLLVGTMTATNVVQKDFRGARRAAGLGTPIWERLSAGEEWDGFLAALMEYQWTRERTPLTDELNAVFYDECQGVLSVAITLMVLVQFRATQLGEVRNEPELMTAGLVHQVAIDELKIIKPMLDALRNGSSEALIQYPDLEQFSRYVDNVIAGAVGILPGQVRQRSDDKPPGTVNSDDPSALLRSALAKRGFGADVIERILVEVRAKVTSGDAFEMVEVALELLRGVQADPKAVGKRKAAARRGTGPDDPLDLRVIIRGARETGKSDDVTAHRALVDAGMIAPVANIIDK